MTRKPHKSKKHPIRYRCAARGGKKCIGKACQFWKWFLPADMRRKSCPVARREFAVESSIDKALGYPMCHYTRRLH